MLSWIVILIVLLLAFEYAGECFFNLFRYIVYAMLRLLNGSF